ncbi:TonB-dependent siderophore receptor [Acinetobacter radioresistens]|uniref:TonB-dependent siderophore receptor n=1 Tax=Acinetobacter radioresistens TaxID=40216 RepID=UPI000DAE6C7D|nr:TonB-dependent siderophore receptor [Acinetobacter radioresistens]AWV86953.1 TonB-dependent siderophore receptor [Acinetobacter radioresistens]MCK4089001.1 TonB-dependent siderophore receptor [Acinetobacter radioresistens]MCX0327836.1 TonB-dependent siderophore receptor [Acinetobacter radioresistens]
MSNRMMKSVLTVSILSAMLSVANAAETDKAQQQENESQPQDAVKLETMVLTAEEQVKQSLGVSIITEEDLNKLPVTNDISEYVRRMPGVNLTGNSATGQRGNNRQIDIRGMGPENTLILIDGKPVNSRNSVRYGWRGERDTRGDSNWVPVNAIESIEVLRGPAAARYGSGAMGGVVNIKTKKVTNQLHGSIETYTNQPENSKEGDTNRISVNLSGPIIQDILSYRIYGNYNKTDNDAPDINPVVGSNGYRAAGREGVENKDINARLAWKMTDHQHLFFDIGSGRQGNLYAGDSQNSNLDPTTNDILSQLFGKETNTLYRDNYALTHEGEWSWGDSKLIAQFDRTKNKRLPEGTAGASEGRINSLEDRVTSTLDTLRFNGEVTVPFKLYVPQNLTIGAEWVEDDFSDQENTKQGDGSYGENLTTGDRSKMKSRIASGYLENNMKITDATDMVVGIRFDDHNRSGSNWSPSLNLSHKLGDYFTLKGGIAKAYKAPNLYQNAEGYLLGTRGNGCPIGLSQCVLQGNVNLKPETSINKEIGFEFQKDIVNASLAWFRNDYEDKITSGDEVTQQVVIGDTTYNVLQWTNIPKALIQGLEGSISLDWGDVTWTNNFTYMTDSVNKKTGNPLSVVPNYTINSIFNYDITDAWDVNFIYTQYGRQKPRQYKETSLEDKQGIITESVKSYGLAGINTGYKFNNNFSGRIGISNLFDEQKLRDNTVNQTYNEPGRAYYASLKYEF